MYVERGFTMVTAPVKRSHTPRRTCIGCRQHDDQTALIRLSLSADATTDTPSVVIDSQRSVAGRGAWLHPAKPCLKTAIKTRAFNRAFRTAVQAHDLEEKFQSIIDAVEHDHDRDESGSEI